MKHVTLAIATVMLPVFSYAYRAVSLCNKTLSVRNVRAEASHRTKDYCSFVIPPGTERIIIHIGLNDKEPEKCVRLLQQMEDRLENGAPIYVIGGMVNSKPSTDRMDIYTFDNVMCASMFSNKEHDQCRPLIWEKNSLGGTYDVPVLPVPYAGKYYICFRNHGDATVCYATVEAVAILN